MNLKRIIAHIIYGLGYFAMGIACCILIVIFAAFLVASFKYVHNHRSTLASDGLYIALGLFLMMIGDEVWQWAKRTLGK